MQIIQLIICKFNSTGQSKCEALKFVSAQNHSLCQLGLAKTLFNGLSLYHVHIRIVNTSSLPSGLSCILIGAQVTGFHLSMPLAGLEPGLWLCGKRSRIGHKTFLFMCMNHTVYASTGQLYYHNPDSSPAEAGNGAINTVKVEAAVPFNLDGIDQGRRSAATVETFVYHLIHFMKSTVQDLPLASGSVHAGACSSIYYNIDLALGKCTMFPLSKFSLEDSKRSGSFVKMLDSPYLFSMDHYFLADLGEVSRPRSRGVD
ncbi:unnamed protein product [Protopolystoma xenopodis]|uniref:Uncharacterized protein n=1 Tax=Protopolystoma xenopodis TaxID=117903 RepID=A0A3S5CI09_9PLAT|nr:unnamed protein product [Protopolystoma xenopodis]